MAWNEELPTRASFRTRRMATLIRMGSSTQTGQRKGILPDSRSWERSLETTATRELDNPSSTTVCITSASRVAKQTRPTSLAFANDVGRGGNDAFGWPLSLATLLLKDLGGPVQEPGQPLLTFDSNLGPFGGLFEESAQDQQINPGVGGDPVASQLPAYLGPWVNQINVGDSMPELDEVFGGINTLTDVPMLEGFIDVLGPNAFSGRQGTWRVSISGSRAADNWDLRVEGPNGFERSYSLSRSASEHEPEAICAIVLRLVPPVQA